MMTDNEIIKALECCFLSERACKDCPYSEFEICDTAKMVRTVIDLTNRQKAEIERLQSMNKKMLDILQEIRTDGVGYQSVMYSIDRILEEMEGEGK